MCCFLWLEKQKPSSLASKQKSFCLIMIISRQPFFVSWAVHTWLPRQQLCSRCPNASLVPCFKLMCSSSVGWPKMPVVLVLFHKLSVFVPCWKCNCWPLNTVYSKVQFTLFSGLWKYLQYLNMKGTDRSPLASRLHIPCISLLLWCPHCLPWAALSLPSLPFLISEVLLSAFVLEAWKSLP